MLVSVKCHLLSRVTGRGEQHSASGEINFSALTDSRKLLKSSLLLLPVRFIRSFLLSVREMWWLIYLHRKGVIFGGG